MPDTADPQQHVKPFVHETARSKALHFSLSEIQSRMQVHEPDALDLEYTRTMMGFMLLHPAPRQALFLGLGTGVTASAATLDPALRVDAVELLPEVIEASAHFRDGALGRPEAGARRLPRPPPGGNPRAAG